MFAESEDKPGVVTGVLYSYGDVFQTANTLVEQMTGWRLSTGGDTRGQYIPNKHRIERNLWRDLGSILPQAVATDDNITPGVVRWLTLIKERNLLEEGLVQLCAVGFKYGPMEAKIDAMAVDTLLIHNDIFTELGSRWMPLINNLLGLTDECVRKLAVLASDLAKAAGDIDSLHYRAGEGRAKTCRAEAYYRMDEPFRRWLAGIHPLKTDMGEAEQEWIRVLKHILFQLGAEMGHQYGEKAIVGRWVDEKRGSRRENTRTPHRVRWQNSAGCGENHCERRLKGWGKGDIVYLIKKFTHDKIGLLLSGSPGAGPCWPGCAGDCQTAGGTARTLRDLP